MINTSVTTRIQLDQLQRWMQAVIMNPGGAAVGVDSAPARRELNVGCEDVEVVICRSRALESLDRLNIYASAYFARLMECMRAEFPMFAKAVGEELFDAFVVAYLTEYPSRSYTLGALGARFTTFLRETRPAENGGPGLWPDFLIELAELEWTFNEVFDGPGIETVELLDANQLRAIPNDQWQTIRLATVPCLRLMRLSYPVNRVYTALRKDQPWEPPPPSATFLAVTRRDYVVRPLELTRPQFHLLRALQEGIALGVAIQDVVELHDLYGVSLTDTLHDWFRDWTSEAFFLRVDADSASELRQDANRRFKLDS